MKRLSVPTFRMISLFFKKGRHASGFFNVEFQKETSKYTIFQKVPLNNENVFGIFEARMQE